MFDLTGKRALVTGAGQSVGAAIARHLAARGADVIVNDVIAERADRVAHEISDAGGTAVARPFDVTDGGEVAAAIAESGRVDIVVNNAGNGGVEPMRPTRFVDMDREQWEGPIRVNLYGVLNTTKAVLSGMIERGWGRVITISSGAGSTGVPIGVAPYSAGKAAGQGFMRAMAAENSPHGLTFNCVALGIMDNVAHGEIGSRLAKGIPAGRVGTGDDVGAVCVYLSSDEAAWMTGQTLHLNGGTLMS